MDHPVREEHEPELGSREMKRDEIKDRVKAKKIKRRKQEIKRIIREGQRWLVQKYRERNKEERDGVQTTGIQREKRNKDSQLLRRNT